MTLADLMLCNAFHPSLSLFPFEGLNDAAFTYQPNYNWTSGADGSIIGEIELPGVAPEDIKLDVQGRKLKLSGVRVGKEITQEVTKKVEENREESKGKDSEKKPEENETPEDSKKVETKVLKMYEAEFYLPRYADTSNIKARFANGHLTIEMPKKPEQQPRRIEITN